MWYHIVIKDKYIMSKSTQYTLGGIIIVAVALFFVLQQSPSQPQPATIDTVEKITITQAFEVFLYAPLYVAKEQGFFESEGLEVTITTAGGDEKAFASLLSGEAQFAVGDPTFVAISGEKGQLGTVVAAVLRGVPFWGVARNEDIAIIKQPSDLNGYSVATFPAPSTAYTLQKNMFQSGGLTPNIKETAFGSLLAALETDQVDIALELEPNVSTAVKNGNRIVYSLNDYYPEFAITGMTALPGYVEQHQETTQKVVNALQKAMTYIRQNPDQVAGFLTKRFPEVPRDIAQDAVRNMIESGVFPSDTVVTKNGWDAAIQARLDAGDLSSAAPYEKYVITTFSQRAR